MGGFPGANGEVRAVVIEASGNLYIGGDFTVVGDVIANGLAKWDGINWSPLRTGTDTFVDALAVIRSDLYAGGSFTRAGGIAARSIAKRDGNSWSALPTGLSGYVIPVVALAVSGGNLYAGRNLNTLGGTAAHSITKWDGSSCSALGATFLPTGGFNPVVSALAVSGIDLYAAGSFTQVGGKVSPFIARAHLLDLPPLSVLRSGRAVTISWPSANPADFTLEQSPALRAPAS